jgi:hypothetical protein
MLTSEQRHQMAAAIVQRMRNEYSDEEGDFDDGYGYLANDASDEELQDEYNTWCKV